MDLSFRERIFKNSPPNTSSEMRHLHHFTHKATERLKVRWRQSKECSRRVDTTVALTRIWIECRWEILHLVREKHHRQRARWMRPVGPDRLNEGPNLKRTRNYFAKVAGTRGIMIEVPRSLWQKVNVCWHWSGSRCGRKTVGSASIISREFRGSQRDENDDSSERHRRQRKTCTVGITTLRLPAVEREWARNR